MTIRHVDLTTEEGNTLSLLLDLLEDHINPYELTGKECNTLDEAKAVLDRICFMIQH